MLFYISNLIFTFLFIIIISFFYKNINNSRKSSIYKIDYDNSVNKIYNLCENVNLEEFNPIKYKNGYELYNYLANRNYSEICKLLKVMGLRKSNNRLFLNSIYGKYNITYIDRFNSFPHESYYRLSPKKYNKKDILFGTYDFQNFIYSYQHPSNCENKKFLLLKGWNEGHISEIHVLSSYLKVALDSNRIAMFDRRYKSNVANGFYCRNYSINWECYLEPLTNCSLSDEEINNSVKYRSSAQAEKVVFLEITLEYLELVPNLIYNYFKPKVFSNTFYLFYWNIQCVTFLFRINKRTYNYLFHYNKQISNIVNNTYINVWIRHGNKIYEMKLIPTNLYYSSISLFFRMWKKTKIYVSSDDPEAIETMSKKFDIMYLKYERKNDPHPKNSLMKGDLLTLNVIADILIALSSNGFVGTLKSNIARILNELRMTVGYRLNAPYFEVGELTNSINFIYSI